MILLKSKKQNKREIVMDTENKQAVARGEEGWGNEGD